MGFPQKKHVAKDALVVPAPAANARVSEVFGKDRRTPVAVSGVSIDACVVASPVPIVPSLVPGAAFAVWPKKKLTSRWSARLV